MTTAHASRCDDERRDPAEPETPGWRAVLDPANLATWAAPIALVVLAIVFQALNPTFLSLGNIESMLTSSAILIVLAHRADVRGGHRGYRPVDRVGDDACGGDLRGGVRRRPAGRRRGRAS